LTELFAREDFTRVLVFTRTKRGADKVARILEGGGVSASAIHGNKSQAQRERALAEFKAGKVRALVATDIAARGIDISAVSHVVQFELPEVPEQYVHRIGRTARAGKDGSAVAFCAEDERPLLRDIERVTRQKIPSSDRRNDPVLAQLSANANMEAKRGAKAEPMGEPQPRRNEVVEGEQRQGRRRRRRGKGGGQAQQAQGHKPQQNRGQQKPQARGASGNQRNDQRGGQHRKGQRDGQHNGQRGPKAQAPARKDVMNVGAGRVNGPVISAHDLMKQLSAKN
jgi:ATP-dependent RNA helicase RhlE